MWQQRRVLVGVCGGIAAYKLCEVVSSLAQAGADVRVMLTPTAGHFVSPLTFATLSRQAAYTDAEFWHHSAGRPVHIDLAEWAEVILIAPLTANSLGKIALGLADNLLTTVLLASTVPVLLAPAMNPEMWQQPIVQQHLHSLPPRYRLVAPERGRMACDAVGVGRLAAPAQILEQLLSLAWTQGQQDWQGRRVVVSSGGTREPLDAVRFIGNPATGRMGLAIARAAADRGAQVTLVQAGELPGSSAGMAVVFAPTAAAMTEALAQITPQADTVIMAAAVADVRPSQTYSGKLAKADLPNPLPLEPVPDVLALLPRQPHQTWIGFAAQTGDPIPLAIAKLKAKHLDAIIANPIDQPERGFGSTWNEVTWLAATGEQIPLPHAPKLELAHRILDLALPLVMAKSGSIKAATTGK